MTTRELPCRRILAATDFSRPAGLALALALNLAARFDAEVHLVHVLSAYDPELFGTVETTQEGQRLRRRLNQEVAQRIEGRLQEALAGVNGQAERVRTVQLRSLKTAPALLSYAKEHQIDLIVLGTHGRHGMKRLMLGSVAEEVVQRAPCDVLTVGGGAPSPPAMRRVLVPLDLSDAARPTLRAAKEIARRFEARLHLLHVIEPLPFPVSITGIVTIFDLVPDIREKARVQLKALLEEAEGPPVEGILRIESGHAATKIVETARDMKADLIVLATHGLTGVEHFCIGSVAERVVRTAPCPVLVTRVPALPNEKGKGGKRGRTSAHETKAAVSS